MATVLTRTNVSTTTKKTDEFTFGDWAGQFIYENSEGQSPDSVQVNANKTGAYFNANFSESSTNFNFSPGAADTALVTAVIAEYGKIVNPTT